MLFRLCVGENEGRIDTVHYTLTELSPGICHAMKCMLQNVLNAAHAQHQELTQTYQREMLRASIDTPWWSAGLAVRTSLQSLADALIR